jgi:hypothetical protein
MQTNSTTYRLIRYTDGLAADGSCTMIGKSEYLIYDSEDGTSSCLYYLFTKENDFPYFLDCKTPTFMEDAA